MPTKKELTEFFSGLTEKALVIVIVVYVGISIGRSIMENYQINQRIVNLQNQLSNLQEESAYLNSLIAYYKTDTFKELKAREELGYQAPGEQVIAVPIEQEDLPTSNENLAKIANSKAIDLPLSNYKKWFQYFFGS